LSIWRRFPQISSPAKTVTPVTVPPGRAKLVANPAWIGSPPIQTIGSDGLAARAARAIASVLATITSGFRLAARRARLANPSGRPSPEYRSTLRFRPSTSPSPRSSFQNACQKRLPVSSMRATRGDNDRHLMLLRPILRPQRRGCYREQ